MPTLPMYIYSILTSAYFILVYYVMDFSTQQVVSFFIVSFNVKFCGQSQLYNVLFSYKLFAHSIFLFYLFRITHEINK